jgi:hypothetical protein
MVLVGRSEKYPDEGGVILPANPRQSGRYLAKDAGLSDHNATWVMLVWSLQDPGHEVFVSYDDSQEIEIEDFGLLTDFLSRGCGPTIGIGNFPD